MEQYKKEFIEFMVDSDVLKFGEFTLKSGRKSPFFMNAGGQRLRMQSCMEGMSVIAQTVRRSKTMGMPGFYWEVN